MADHISQLQAEQGTSLSAVQDAVPKFKQVTNYSTFLAEYALTEGNVVVHFFKQTAGPSVSLEKWKNAMAAALEAVAPECFQATAPRLVASYTEEMKSWWLRAKNYDHLIDFDGFMEKFFDRMDAYLDNLENSAISP